jgi:agmatinase
MYSLGFAPARYDDRVKRPPLDFDPDAAITTDTLFGLPFSPEESEVVLIPVPWDATVSYGVGASAGPAAIRKASRQLDILDRETGKPYERGIALLPIPEELEAKNTEARVRAQPVILAGDAGDDPELLAATARVNSLCEDMNEWVYATARNWIEREKLVGLIGGDHSVPFGLFRAIAEAHEGVGILHLDAHADLRQAYEGFTWSHASIMYNAMERIPGISRLVQVGIRDFGHREDAYIRESGGRIRTFFDPDLRAGLLSGESWRSLIAPAIDLLPAKVHLSFDIDGLDPTLCPSTGTPVPGGLSFAEAVMMLRLVAESGREVVGLDLCEVAPDPAGVSEWDGNVGARLLYKMIGFALMTRRA